MAGEPVAVGSPVDRSVVLRLSRGGGGVSVFVRGSCSSSSDDSKEKKGEACALGLVVLSGVLGEIVESVLVLVGCADCRGERSGSEVEVGCFREDRAKGIMGLSMIGVTRECGEASIEGCTQCAIADVEIEDKTAVAILSAGVEEVAEVAGVIAILNSVVVEAATVLAVEELVFEALAEV